jgi:hypothetical protein
MIQSKAEQALLFVREIAQGGASAIDVHNAFFGNGGKFAELFPTRAEREPFLETPEYREICRIRSAMRRSQKSLTP